MWESQYRKTFAERQALVALSCRTTLLYDRGNGTIIRQHLPFEPLSVRESAVTAWCEARRAGHPEPREVCHLLVRHPCFEEIWTVAAKMVLRAYSNYDEWVDKLIPHAQGTVWIVYADNQQAFESALARPVERFPGWGYEFIVHRCQESCRELSGELLWPKSLNVAQLSVVQYDAVAPGTDVVALVLGRELRLIVETYDDRTRTVIDYDVEGLNDNEIAEKMGISRHQLFRFREKMCDRLGRDLKEWRPGATNSTVRVIGVD